MAAGDELRDEIAKAALDEAAYDALGDGWVDAKRIPDGVDPEDWECGPVEWDYANDHWRDNGYRIADKILAALRPHLGLGDEERAIMLRELDLIERDVSEFEGAELRRWIAERVMVLRAIAGRGEVGTAEGGGG